MTETQERTRQRARRLTGARELMLIQDCAVDDLTIDELAERYDCEPHTIENFRARHRERIATAAADQVDALAASGLWITRKLTRLAVYQDEALRNIRLIEDIQAEAAAIAASLGLPAPPDTSKITQLQSVIFRALDAAAEETGQKLVRGSEQLATGKLRHIVEGLEGWEP